MTYQPNKWITFHKIVQPDGSFQSNIFYHLNSISIKSDNFYLVDVISDHRRGRILISHSEEIQLFGNGIVYPISIVLSRQLRTAADELLRHFQLEFIY